MRRFLLFLLLLCLTVLFRAPVVPAQGGDAIVVVQAPTSTGDTAATNPSEAFPGTQTVGNSNLILVEYCGTGSNPCGNNNTGPITSVTDTGGNNYSRICGPLTNLVSGSFTTPCGGNNTFDYQNTIFEAWLANNIKAAVGNTVTMHMTNTSNMRGWNIFLFELRPTSGGTVVLDQAVTTQTLSVNPTTGMATGTTPLTTAANELAIAWCLPVSGQCIEPNAPWVNDQPNGFDTHSDIAYLLLTSMQTVSEFFGHGNIGTGDEAIAGIFTLKTQSGSSFAPNPPADTTVVVQ